MSSTAGNTVTPGHATSTRPGVWLTDLSLVLMALIWGVNFSIVKYGTTLVDPLAYNGLRVMLAAVLLATIITIDPAPFPPRRLIVTLLGLGVLGNAVYQGFFVLGISRTSASDAALVIAATPAFIAIIGHLRGTERTPPRRATGIALSMSGIALVVLGSAHGTQGHSSLVGDLLVLCGSLSWAIYTVLLKPHTGHATGWQISGFTMIGGAIPLFVVALPAISHADWAHFPMRGWSAIFYSGVFALVVAYYFWYRGLRILGPTRTSMYSNLQPLIAVLVAWGMLGETPTIWQGVGAALIMGGLVLTRT